MGINNLKGTRSLIRKRQRSLGRNPMDPRQRRKFHDRLETFTANLKPIITVGNLLFALLGAPGMGKTRTIERILLLYPQESRYRRH